MKIPRGVCSGVFLYVVIGNLVKGKCCRDKALPCLYDKFPFNNLTFRFLFEGFLKPFIQKVIQQQKQSHRCHNNRGEHEGIGGNFE